jgi:hypothetical protein
MASETPQAATGNPAAEATVIRPGLNRQFSTLDGYPGRDDPEVTALIAPARRMPRDRVETCVETLLRCALGYQRTGNPEFMTRLASSAVTSFRARLDPAGDALYEAQLSPADPATTLDVGDVLRARGMA